MKNMSKDTKKLFRLQTSEKYTTKKLSDTSFEIFTKDLKFKANVSTLGTIILTNCEVYAKTDFYKLRNFCALLQRCHFGI
jgi:hypothetical protein